MARVAYQFMFMSLAGILLAVFFVLQPGQDPAVAQFQQSVKNQVARAAQELWGNDSVVEPLLAVTNALELFYDESATQTLALITPTDNVIETMLSFHANYQISKQIALAPVIKRIPTEEPIYNIIPVSPAESLIDPFFNENLAYLDARSGKVAGESIGLDEGLADDSEHPDGLSVVPDPNEHFDPEGTQTPYKPRWITLEDSTTGFPYCVAIFSGEVNSYPGKCAEDIEVKIHEN